MINKIKINFNKHDELRCGFDLGPIMQGLLMEKISPEYADKLHISEVHPYSQHTENNNGCLVWVISTLNSEAREKIIAPLISDDLRSAEIKNKDIKLSVSSKEIVSITYDELFNRHYLSGNTYRYAEIEFITPASFKSDGKYIIFPNSQMIFKNLIRKYDCASGTTEIYDDALMEQIGKNTDIVEYSLRSVKYMLDGGKIPSFIGRITLKINGAPEFIRLMNMLLEFGEYSGTGIKTAMGMGAYKIIRKSGAI